MSTIHPFETDSIREKLKTHGISMIDCPIGRTSVEAKIGKSLLMVGGDKNDIETVKPVLDLIGDTLKDCGGPGMGSRMKIVNNYSFVWIQQKSTYIVNNYSFLWIHQEPTTIVKSDSRLWIQQ